jgi:hypothetical protein
MGPFPPGYDGGMRLAIGVLHRYNRPEKHEGKLKFSSARKARSVHSNMFMASTLGGATVQSLRSDKGHQALTTAPTYTLTHFLLDFIKSFLLFFSPLLLNKWDH